MLEALTDPLRDGIAQRAMLELVILGAVCGPLGVWIVLYRQSYAAESIAHSMLPGLVVAALIGVPLGLGAAAGLTLAAAAVALASRQGSVSPDVAVGVTVTTLFGLGSLLALAPTTPLRLGELLFGDPLSVSDGELLASAFLASLALAGLVIGHRTLLLGSFDPQSASSLGGSTGRAGALLLALLALTTLIGVQALGNLLVVAIVIAPAAAALQLCSRLVEALAIAALLAIAAGIAGVYLSYHADLAAGASIALCAIAFFVLSLTFATERQTRRDASPPGPAANMGS